MAGPHRTAAHNTVWLLRTDDDTPADDTRQLLDMLGLIGDQPRHCHRHGTFHVDTTDEPATNPRAADTALAALTGDLTTNAPPSGLGLQLKEGPPPRGRHCPPGLRRLFEEPQPPTPQPQLRQPPPPPVRPKAKPKPKPKATPKPKAEVQHGAEPGLRKHRRDHTPFCGPCKTFWSAPLPPAECGTESGVRKHRREGSTVCPKCVTARREADSRRRAAKRQAAIEAGTAPTRRVARCGTPSGYKRHKKQGTDICAACLEAKRADNRKHGQATRDRDRATRETAQQQAAQAA